MTGSHRSNPTPKESPVAPNAGLPRSPAASSAIPSTTANHSKLVPLSNKYRHAINAMLPCAMSLAPHPRQLSPRRPPPLLTSLPHYLFSSPRFISCILNNLRTLSPHGHHATPLQSSTTALFLSQRRRYTPSPSAPLTMRQKNAASIPIGMLSSVTTLQTVKLPPGLCVFTKRVLFLCLQVPPESPAIPDRPFVEETCTF